MLLYINRLFAYICKQFKPNDYGEEHFAGFVEMETERAS